MFLLIDNYDSFTYNLYHYLVDLGVDALVKRNDALSVDEALKSDAEGIILSPGPSTPDQSGICLPLVSAAMGANIPLLGVCLGHQAIGQALGGTVVRAPEVMHGKTSTIKRRDDLLFDGLPAEFNVTRYHSLILDRQSLPDSLEITAETEDGTIMAMRHVTNPVYGVQFHPESIASEYGHELLANFIELSRRRSR